MALHAVLRHLFSQFWNTIDKQGHSESFTFIQTFRDPSMDVLDEDEVTPRTGLAGHKAKCGVQLAYL